MTHDAKGRIRLLKVLGRDNGAGEAVMRGLALWAGPGEHLLKLRPEFAKVM
jgi:hypothetical protein